MILRTLVAVLLGWFAVAFLVVPSFTSADEKDEKNGKEPGESVAIPVLDEKLEPLVSALAADEQKARLLVLAAPRWRDSRKVAEVLVKSIFPALPEVAEISLHLVWCSRDGEDTIEHAREEAPALVHPWVRQYYVADERLGDRIRPLIENLENIEGEPLDAIALLYEPGKVFDEEGKLAAPHFWFHRRRNLHRNNRLRGKTALARIKAVLPVDSEDVRDIPTRSMTVKKDPRMRFLLHGPLPGERPDGKECGLLVVLPGGNGSEEFRPFVKRILRNAAGPGWVVAQLISTEWHDGQFERTVWPTTHNPVPGMGYPTEDYVRAVIEQLLTEKPVPLDMNRVYLMGWSSGGPPTYAMSLRGEDTRITGYYIAQSIFPKRWFVALEKLPAGSHPYFFLDHSPQDEVCPYDQAEEGAALLEKLGARTKLHPYEGGHGWKDAPYARIRAGLEWLDEQQKLPQ